MDRSSKTRASPSARWIKRWLVCLRYILTTPARPPLDADQAHAQRVQRCSKFFDKHGVSRLLNDATVLKDVIYLPMNSYLKPREQDRFIAELLSLASQRGKDTACRIILPEQGRWSRRILITVCDWRVPAFIRPTCSIHLKETRFRSAPDSSKDQIFAMLLRVYHAELNTTAMGCLHIFFALGSKSHFLELLCAGANKWTRFPQRSSVIIPDPEDEADGMIGSGTRVVIAPGETTVDFARKYKDQLSEDKFHLLSSFKPILQEMCLMTIRKQV